MEKQNKSLTVYRASAGSGKTFTLAVEYIKLLVKNPAKYKEILAVTFTNKATEEMKHRIVSQLYGLANGLTSSADYMKKITEELDMEEKDVRKNASIALHNLIHNYNAFKVQTIDAFFQSILRNMSKELGIGNNIRISLNDEQIIYQAVDNLFDTLDTDKELRNWILEYIGEKMDTKNSWDIAGEIKSFGENISSEFFKTHEHLLQHIEEDDSFYEKYKRMLKEEEKRLKEEIIRKSEEFFEKLDEHNIDPDNLYQKSKGVAGYFTKMKNGETNSKMFNTHVRTSMENKDKWGNPEIAPIAESCLMKILREAEELRKKNGKKINSIKLTLSTLNRMRLLSGIKKETERLNRENSRFMLTNTQSTLNAMIKGGNNDAPFIFEKIGSYIRHIMIDEFQDTSLLQWENFKVLLNECLSNTDSTADRNLVNNLIVGDVKQSIYRFRLGDWRLLNDIDQEFTGEQINIENLSDNWRSEHNIVSFNNSFFKHAVKNVATQLVSSSSDSNNKTEDITPEMASMLNEYANKLVHAYNDVKQGIKKDVKKGFVKIEFLPQQKSEDFEAEALQRTLNYIRGLINQGVSLSEICIIVKKNAEATDTAKYFAEHAPELRIVSDQAFTLEASPLVMMIVSAMKYLANANNMEAKVMLLKLYTKYIRHQDIADSELLTDDKAFSLYMPVELQDKNKKEELKGLSIYEMAEAIYRILKLEECEGQGAYASAFFDHIKKYVDEDGGIIDDFIHKWDEELCRKAISADAVDSIRIITIHKSKGLEYPHVIIPFCNWYLDPKQHYPTLWCRIEDEVIGQLPFIPVTYTNKDNLKDSLFELYGCEEWIQELVDNLNLLYVAFTRPKKSLYVISDQNNSDGKRGKLLFDIIEDVADELENATIMGMEEYKENIEIDKKNQKIKKSKNSKKTEEIVEIERKPVIFTYGRHEFEKTDKKEKTEENIFETKPEPLNIEIRSYDSNSITFRQSNDSREFAKDEAEAMDANRMTTIGSIMHLLFSKIHTIDDVDKVLQQFEFDGVLYNDDVTPEILREVIRRKFNNSMVSNWFSNKWTVFNECNIMRIENGTIITERPDRVITDGKETIVIDYKFGKHNDSYKKQVTRYMKLLSEMGYTNVKGYIWYVNRENDSEIVAVE